MSELVIRNADVLSLELSVPEGHRHLRATLRLADGTSLVLQEATVANLVRAYIGVVTHPTRRGVRLSGRALSPEGLEGRLKEDFAPWQLLEDS